MYDYTNVCVDLHNDNMLLCVINNYVILYT